MQIGKSLKSKLSLLGAVAITASALVSPFANIVNAAPYPGEGPYTITVKNKAKAGGDHFLEGAKYKLEKTHNKDATGKLTKLEKPQMIEEKTIGSTDKQVIFTVKEPGEYKVTQVERPFGYLLGQGFEKDGEKAMNEVKVDFPRMENGVIAQNQGITIEPKLVQVKKPVELTKLGEREVAVDGTVFKLSSTELNVNALKSDKITDKEITVANGKINLGDLVEGKYTLVETTPSKGYGLNNKIINLEVKGDRVAATLDDISVEYDVKSNAHLTADGQFQNYLKPTGNPEEPGRQFDKNVKIDGAEAAYSKAVNANVGQKVEYEVKVDVPKDIKDYEKFEITDQIDSRFTVDAGSVKNDNAGLDVSFEGNKLVAKIAEPAKFEKADQVITFTFKATVNNTAKDKDVIPNNLALEFNNGKGETGTPNLPDPQQPKVTVQEGGLTIKKVDGETNAVLKGAEFKVQAKVEGKWQDFTNPSGAATTGVTGEDGTLKFERLPYGEYRIVETKAPVLEDGTEYRLNKSPDEITVNGDNQSVELEVKNYKTTTWLPGTGTLAMVPFALIMAAGATGLVAMRKKSQSK